MIARGRENTIEGPLIDHQIIGIGALGGGDFENRGVRLSLDIELEVDEPAIFEKITALYSRGLGALAPVEYGFEKGFFEKRKRWNPVVSRIVRLVENGVFGLQADDSGESGGCPGGAVSVPWLRKVVRIGIQGAEPNIFL